MTTLVSSKSKFSFLLRTKLQLAFPTLSKNRGFRDEGKDYREWFKDYLFTLHTIIRASVPLMAAAEQRSLQFENEPLCLGLVKYYHKHVREEAEHDNWLLADLQAIGIPHEQVLSRKPSEAVAELIGSQYYWIHHWHPVCLLGYIAVMEGYPPQRRAINELISKTGYSEAAFRTLAKHSYLDPHHRQALNVTLDELPLNHRQQGWITLDALYTLGKWREIARSI